MVSSLCSPAPPQSAQSTDSVASIASEDGKTSLAKFTVDTADGFDQVESLLVLIPGLGDYQTSSVGDGQNDNELVDTRLELCIRRTARLRRESGSM